jgi:hypothetical protein
LKSFKSIIGFTSCRNPSTPVYGALSKRISVAVAPPADVPPPSMPKALYFTELWSMYGCNQFQLAVPITGMATVGGGGGAGIVVGAGVVLAVGSVEGIGVTGIGAAGTAVALAVVASSSNEYSPVNGFVGSYDLCTSLVKTIGPTWKKAVIFFMAVWTVH